MHEIRRDIRVTVMDSNNRTKAFGEEEPSEDATEAEGGDNMETEQNKEEHHEGSEDEENNSENISFASSNDDSEPEPSPFEEIKENIYLFDRKKSRTSKEARRMKCDCVFDPEDPLFIGCGETCLNRLLMIECTSRCRCGEFCTNKNFQRGTKYKLEVFKTDKKGFGLRTLESIPKGSFVIEYCGEIVDHSEFLDRTERYDQEGRKHYYFMTLKTNEVIDATKKGAVSRFINHSCDPNCETQKWTVYGFLRIGFFAVKDISAGQELSFDYQFERYGEKAQKCYCGADNCRGVIGGEKQARLKPNFYDRASVKKRKRKKEEDDDELIDQALEAELSDLLGEVGQIVDPEQVLELTRLMVKVERSSQRLRLLKVLQCCSDSFALKSFVRYNGLSLLWSWMIDATNDSKEYKLEILSTLQHVPVINMNQLKDSKVFQVVQKWAKLAGPSCHQKSSDAEEDGSSNSDVENEGKTGSDSSSPSGETVEEGILDDDASPEETGSKDSDDTKDDEGKEEENGGGNNLKDGNERKETKRKRDKVATVAIDLLEQWKSLKEIFKIPKKPQMTPDKKSRPGSDNEACLSPADDRRGKKKNEMKNEERASRTFSPSRTQADSPLQMLSESSTSVAGGMSPVLPFLSPVRGAQSKALASSQESTKSSQDVDNGKSRDVNSAESNDVNTHNNTNNSQDGNGPEFGELWDDLFENKDAGTSDTGNMCLGVDDNEEDPECGELHHRKRWPSRWQNEYDGRRGGRFSKNFRKKKRRGSYSWNQEHYQYPGRRIGGRHHGSSQEGDEMYEGRSYGGEYGQEYGNEYGDDYGDERDYRSSHRSRHSHKGDHHLRTNLPADNYRDSGYHKRNYLDNQGMRRGHLPGPMPGAGPAPRPLSGPIPGPDHNIRMNPPQRLQPPIVPRPVGTVEPGQVCRGTGMQGPMNSQMGGDVPIDVVQRPRSGWQGMQTGIVPAPAAPIPPPQMPPRFHSQPPPPQQPYNPMPPTPPPRAPVLQLSVPPPPAQLPQPVNSVLSTFGRFPVSGPTTPTPSTPPVAPVPSVTRPVLVDCTTQPPPPSQPPFPIQPPLRFLSAVSNSQQLPLNPTQNITAPALTLPNPLPSLLGSRLQAPAPLPLGQLPTSIPLQQPTLRSLLSPTNTLPPAGNNTQPSMVMNKVNNQPKMELSNPQLTSPPIIQERIAVTTTTQVLSPVNDPLAESSPISSKPIPPLPANWKTATDPEGKIYYYHTVTRQTQWDPPTWDDEAARMADASEKDYSIHSGPRTPSLSPPHSPVTPCDRPGSVMAAADTTVNRLKNTSSQSVNSHRSSSDHLTPRAQKIRDAFKTKLSAVVVNCLNPYQKVDCRQGKITKTEDFKFLARKLTHGLMLKEMARVKTEEALECNDSVKIKVKEYIRNYMKKFGDVYIRS